MSIWEEWAVSDTVHAEDINPGEVIRCQDDDGVDFAGEVVKVEPEGEYAVCITVESDLDGERHDIPFTWDQPTDVLHRDYSGVEV